MPEETITITKQAYDGLVHDSRVLDALCTGGVNNWEGYEMAMEAMEWEEED